MKESPEYDDRGLRHQEAGRPPTHRVIPDPREVPVLSVVEAGRLLRMGRSKAYVQARRFIDTKGQEGIPTIEFGHRLVCPTAKILELVGLDQG